MDAPDLFDPDWQDLHKFHHMPGHGGVVQAKSLTIGLQQYLRRGRAALATHTKETRRITQSGRAELKHCDADQTRWNRQHEKIKEVRRRSLRLEKKLTGKPSIAPDCPVHAQKLTRVETLAQPLNKMARSFRPARLRVLDSVPGAEDMLAPRLTGRGKTSGKPINAGSQGNPTNEGRMGATKRRPTSAALKQSADQRPTTCGGSTLHGNNRDRAQGENTADAQSSLPGVEKTSMKRVAFCSMRSRAGARAISSTTLPMSTSQSKRQRWEIREYGQVRGAAKDAGEEGRWSHSKRSKTRDERHDAQVKGIMTSSKPALVCTCPVPRTPGPNEDQYKTPGSLLFMKGDALKPRSHQPWTPDARLGYDYEEDTSVRAAEPAMHDLLDDVTGYKDLSKKVVSKLPQKYWPQYSISGGDLIKFKRAVVELLKVKTFDTDSDFWRGVMPNSFQRLRMLNTANRLRLQRLREEIHGGAGDGRQERLPAMPVLKQTAVSDSMGLMDIKGVVGRVRKGKSSEELPADGEDEEVGAWRSIQDSTPKLTLDDSSDVEDPKWDDIKLIIHEGNTEYWRSARQTPSHIIKYLQRLDGLQYMEDAHWSKYIEYLWDKSFQHFGLGKERAYEGFDYKQFWDFCLYMARLLLKAEELVRQDCSSHGSRKRHWWRMRGLLAKTDTSRLEVIDEFKELTLDANHMPPVYLTGLEVKNIFDHFLALTPEYLKTLSPLQMHNLGKVDRFQEPRKLAKHVDRDWKDMFCQNGHVTGTCYCPQPFYATDRHRKGAFTVGVLSRTGGENCRLEDDDDDDDDYDKSMQYYDEEDDDGDDDDYDA